MKKIFLLFMLIFILGCTSQDSRNQNLPELPITRRDFRIGIAGFIPRNYPDSNSNDWQDYFDEVPNLGEVFGVYVAWNDSPDESGIPKQIHTAVEISEKGGITPVIAIGYNIEEVHESYFHDHGEAYRNTVLATLSTYRLEYLAIGVEVNSLHAKISPEVFNDFVAFYKETYDRVKEVNPNIKVFTIFQLELMKGEAWLTGLELTPQWELIDLFEDKLDLVGFTVYPFLEYNSVSEIPPDYYTEISNYTTKPIAFTEMGWPTNSAIVPGDEQEQVTFLLDLLESTNSLNVELFIYPFLHDTPYKVELFETIGLKKSNGAEKQAYQYWLALKSLIVQYEQTFSRLSQRKSIAS